MSEAEARALLHDWEGFWSRPDQRLPQGNWATWAIIAGRGFGKTRTGAESIRSLVTGRTPLARGAYSRVALVGETAADVRDVMVEGPSGILAISPRDFRPFYEPSKRRLTWPNGAVATTYNATEPDQLRGPEHDLFWADEIAKWAKAEETWDQLQFGLRLGSAPRGIITTTPRPIPILKQIISEPSTVLTKGRTLDNAANLSRRFIDRIHSKYAGTRLGRQELEAEILEDLPGALWVRSYFDPPKGSKAKGRINATELPQLVRIVVAVDPSGVRNASDDGDYIGIIVAGIDEAGHGYVLADRSMKGGPGEWGRAVIEAYRFFNADRIVAESNYGGGMVEATIRAVDPSAPVTLVTASRGKVIRAEPVSALYEQGRVSHVSGADPRERGDSVQSGLSILEDQLCLFAPSGYAGEGSPDRADALVWALTELMVETSRKRAGVLW